MTQRINRTKFQGKAKSYVKENWGFPFIAAFILLLLASAILLSAGGAATADLTAVTAYFTLAIGVGLQLVCLGKNRSKREQP